MRKLCGVLAATVLLFGGMSKTSGARAPGPASGPSPAAPLPPRGAAVYRPATHTWHLEPSLVGQETAPADAGSASASACAWDFTANLRVHPPMNGAGVFPDIAYGLDGLIGVAWWDDHLPGGYHIFYSESTDQGATWSLPEQIDTRTTGTVSKFVDLEFTPEGTPIAVWEDDRFGPLNIFLAKRSGGTPPWSTNVLVNSAGSPPHPLDKMHPSVAVRDARHYFVAWTDWREGAFNQVYMRRTTNGGTTWGGEVRVSDELGFEPVAANPCLIVDPTSPIGMERLTCMTDDWRGDVPGGRLPNMFAYRSTNAGATWSTGAMVNDIEPGYQTASSHCLVWLSDSTYTAGWYDSQPTQPDAHFRTSVSTDQGLTWSASARVDPPSLNNCGTWSSIAAIGGTIVFAVFDNLEADRNAYLRASSDGGRTWVEDVCRIDDGASGTIADLPVVAVLSASEVHCVWRDSRDGSPHIYSSHGTLAPTAIGPEAGSPDSRARLRLAPNPSRSGTWVRIAVGEAVPSGWRLRIADAAGRTVRILEAGSEPEVGWNGAGGDGRPVPAGVYWVSLERGDAGSRRQQAKIVRLP